MAANNRQPNIHKTQIEESLELLTSSTSVPMLLYRDETTSLINPAVENLTGYAAEELIGVDALKVILSSDSLSTYSESINNGFEASFHFEAAYRTKTGEIRWADFHISKIDGSDRPIKLITMMDFAPKDRPPGNPQKGMSERYNDTNVGNNDLAQQTLKGQSQVNRYFSLDPIEPNTTETLSQAYQQLEQLSAIGQAIAGAPSLEDRMQAVAKGVVEQLGFDLAVVTILDKEKQTLSQASIYPMGARIKMILKSIGWELNAIDFPYDPGVNPIRDQLRAGIPYIGHSLSDLLCPPLPRRLISLAVRIYGIQTVLDVPLVVDDEVVGFLLILSRQPDIAPEDQRAVEIVARQAATAIERARYLQRLHKRTDELVKSVERLESVRALGEDIAQAKNIDDKLNILVQGVVERLDFNSAHIRLHDQYTSLSTRSAIYPFNAQVKKTLGKIGLEIDSPKYRYVTGLNPTLDNLLAGERYLGHTFTDLISPPLPRDLAAVIQRLYKIKTILAVPLSVEEKIVGWLGVTTSRDAINVEDQHAVELIGHQAAAAIETASTFADLEQRSQELEAALIELERTQATLEKRVAERTSEIQAQKQHYEALVLNSPIAIVMLDLDNNVLACNPAFEKLFGYTQEDVDGQFLDDLLAPPDGYDEAVGYTNQVLSGKTIRSTRKRRTKSGELISVELFGVPVTVDGEQIGVLALYNDISERIKAESALRESEGRLELAISGAGLGLWDKDLTTGNTVYNHMWAEMLGYSLDDFDPHADMLFELIHPDDFLLVKHALDAHIEGQTPLFEVTHRLKAKSGDWKWILSTGKIVEYDDEGRPLRAVGIHMDITERVQAEQALQKSEERYQIIYESAPDAYYLSDLIGTFVDGNKFAEELTGYKRKDLLGKNFLELNLLPKTQIPKAAKLLAMNVLGRPTGPDEFTFNRKDGTKIDLAIRTFPVEIDGKSLVLGIARDVTERKRMEAQQQRINHDLELINQLSQEISARLDPEQVYNAIHRAAAQLMPADVFVIALLDDLNQEINLVYISERGELIPSRKTSPDEGLSGHIISSGQPLITGNFDQTHEKKVNSIIVGDPEHETQSVLAVPMKRGENTIGMLSAQSFELDAYDEHDQQMLEMLSSHAQLALENAQLFAEVQWLAITDGLTGLYNRFYFDQQLNIEFARARRYAKSLGTVIIDPDSFKQVNDQYGHPAGDEVLKMFAELISHNARKSDIVARYGGDEFVILLPETDLAGTLNLAEKIRLAVETHIFSYQDQDIRFTISVGVAATSDQNFTDPDMLTKQADQALYQAKRSGRNRVCYDPLE